MMKLLHLIYQGTMYFFTFLNMMKFIFFHIKFKFGTQQDKLPRNIELKAEVNSTLMNIFPLTFSIYLAYTLFENETHLHFFNKKKYSFFFVDVSHKTLMMSLSILNNENLLKFVIIFVRF